jgi:putative intracellular protease/amidase
MLATLIAGGWGAVNDRLNEFFSDFLNDLRVAGRLLGSTGIGSNGWAAGTLGAAAGD